ncbi:hypothetical protein Cpir12675_006087 [Ceratocystis pirilliformis]|uniref:Uncharacterized protein n=1 Tax=Ceratocystis pirilliformis TaxID=259994 RepID=A0ABR3YLE8_9PEZI
MDARNSRAQMRFVIGEIADLEALEAIWDTTLTANIGKTGHAIADWVGAAWERVTGNYIIFREVLSCSWDLLMLTSLMILEERRSGGFFDCKDKWKKENDIILTWDYLRGEWTESLLGGKERMM